MQPLKTILNNSYTDNISDGGCGGTNFPSVFVIIKTVMFLKRGAEMVGRFLSADGKSVVCAKISADFLFADRNRPTSANRFCRPSCFNSGRYLSPEFCAVIGQTGLLTK